MPIEEEGYKVDPEIQKGLDDLKAANEKLGGKLYVVFGEGKGEAFVFPTPNRREIITDNGTTSRKVIEYLVADSLGFQLIQIDENSPYAESENKKLSGCFADPAPDGYSRSGWGIRELRYRPDEIETILTLPTIEFQHHSTEIANVSRLITEDISVEVALEIVKVNKERAEKETAVERGKNKGIEESTAIARRLNEVLGPFS